MFLWVFVLFSLFGVLASKQANFHPYSQKVTSNLTFNPLKPKFIPTYEKKLKFTYIFALM